ncbi:UDP-N-acetylmuramoyl-L-alanine--D-glutamate ligase [Microaceticoccus formicicus]|uniref:UDP-N-acetylmuramoyl-L-alanine--D-glutamate ligase n=1 Tax=Microaceticoccus formicicus TaxID=3118105 RepID=UPI003CD03629|nr:UDP-N-acetylmuramoyl-L-alanine--D-glutamate ligase [Peptoniphilaceae bacterium AMB_02]
MILQDKKILILGFGITGISAAETLHKKAAKIYVQDFKYDEIISKNPRLTDLNLTEIKTTEEILKIKPDYCIKSPGIHPNNEFVVAVREAGIPLMSDLELVYQLYGDRKIIAITGTNGKTTTTALVGEIINSSKHKAHIAGNIGIGMLPVFENNRPDDFYIIECSSFQLEDTVDFRANIAGIINITPDHLDWHGSYDAYKESKLKILKNADKNDVVVLNYDDKYLKDLNIETDAKVLYVSKENEIDGIFVKDGKIINNEDDSCVMEVKEIPLLGKHNLENVLMAIGICTSAGIDKSTIRNAVNNFKGVEHRIEFVREVQGTKYYNDSKGTNVDATINALNAFESKIILIAGGYDKKIEFDELIENFNNKVKALVLMGETAEKIKSAALNAGYENIFIVDNMMSAVKKCQELSKPGDSVLLSPACASWGMYNNFEERGVDFKNNVKAL